MENVAIFDSPGKGRGLKATKEFWAGDVIFSEPSLAAVVFDRYSNDAQWWGMCSDVVIRRIFGQLKNVFSFFFTSRYYYYYYYYYLSTIY